MKTLILTPIFIFMISLDSVQSSTRDSFRRNSRIQRVSAQSTVEPPELNSDGNLFYYNLGQIVRHGNNVYIVRKQDGSAERWLQILNPHEIVLLDRIRNRHPTSPAHYQIPLVTYKVGDRLMNGETQIGEGGDGHMWDMGLHAGGIYIDVIPENGNVLERLDWVRHESVHQTISERTHMPFATRWRDMWIVQDLLPRGDAERALAARLDQNWAESQNRRRHD